ncbi:hypothetical protein FRC03_011899 [Tulasnella sp. 419]|nr:hypothetical protein FRC03_011899 [Tulasnella sp. 419]
MMLPLLKSAALLLSILIGRAWAYYYPKIDASNSLISYSYGGYAGWGLFKSPNSSCTNQCVTEHVGDLASLRFESNTIEVYATTDVEGVVIGIELDSIATKNITLNSGQLAARCSLTIYNATFSYGPHVIRVILLERQRSSTGAESGALAIEGFRYREYSQRQQPRNLPPYVYSGAVGGIALIGAITLQYFSPDRRRKPFKRRTYNTLYDVSDMPPFSQKRCQHPSLHTSSNSATLRSTTGDDVAPEFHIEPTPSSY